MKPFNWYSEIEDWALENLDAECGVILQESHRLVGVVVTPTFDINVQAVFTDVKRTFIPAL